MSDIIERLNASAAVSEMGRNLAGTPQTCREAAAEIAALREQVGALRGPEFREALEMAHDLIQEAKGADGPKGGFVTDHLDDAENWLDHVAKEHDRRVTELLAANNREVENRRMLAAVLRKITHDRNARVHLADTLFGEIEDAIKRIAR